MTTLRIKTSKSIFDKYGSSILHCAVNFILVDGKYGNPEVDISVDDEHILVS